MAVMPKGEQAGARWLTAVSTLLLVRRTWRRLPARNVCSRVGRRWGTLKFYLRILLMIQDLLTVFFIVGGLGLLWVNLRELRRRKVIIRSDDHDGFRTPERQQRRAPHARAESKAIPIKRK